MKAWIFDFVPWWLWAALFAFLLLVTVQLWLPLAAAAWRVMPAWLRFLLGGFLAVLLAYAAGRNKGRQNERVRQQERDATAVERRRRSDAEVDAMPPKQRRKEMDEWYRD